MVICVLIARSTVWGRQFWRITGAYFSGPESVKVWLWLGLILLVGDGRRTGRCAASATRATTCERFQAVAGGLGSDNDALKESGKHGFYFSMVIFSVLAALFIRSG